MARQDRDRLTERQKRFVEEYLATGQPTEAARRAGYAVPNVEGTKQLHRPLVQAAIRAAQGQQREQRLRSREERLERLCEIGFSDAKDRVRALELVARMQGELVHKSELTMPQLSHLSFAELLEILKHGA